MLGVVGAFITSFLISFLAIPSIIRVADLKLLYDEPGVRKSHHRRIPTLGGLAIFAGFIFSLTFWSNQQQISELQYIISAIIILFFMGMKDDIINLVAYKKLAGQIVAAFILVHWGGIQLQTMYGLFGISDIPNWVSYILSMFTIVVITNSFNLIDGIDCLAGATGLICATTFGYWFYEMESYQFAILSFALSGSLLAFLWYNRTPAKIFMGDTGSLIIGLSCSILAIKLIETVRVLPIDHPHKILSVPVIAISVLILPLFDTLRVFFIRILNGQSPLAADRNHIHHMLVDLGYSHHKASSILGLANIVFIAVFFKFQYLKGEVLLFLLLTSCLLLTSWLAHLRGREKEVKKKNIITLHK